MDFLANVKGIILILRPRDLVLSYEFKNRCLRFVGDFFPFLTQHGPFEIVVAMFDPSSGRPLPTGWVSVSIM